MERAIRLFAPIAVGVWLLHSVFLQAGQLGLPAVWIICLAAGYGLASVILLIGREWATWSAIGILTSASAVLLSSDYAPNAAYLCLIASNLAIAVCALLKSAGRADAAIAALTGVSVVMLLLLGPGPQGWAPVIAVLTRGVVTALSFVWIKEALLRTAQWRDQIAADQLDAELESEAIALRREQLHEARCVLHDSAVNTLGAISLGIADAEVPQLRRRAISDLAQIDSLGTAAQGQQLPLSGLVRRCTDRAEELGLRVDLQFAGLDVDVPGRAAVALTGAMNEVLLNIAKHSHVREAFVMVSTSDGQVRIVIADLGSGFDPNTAQFGGLTESVLRRGARAGIDTQLSSAVGQGTTVAFEWTPALPSPAEPLPGPQPTGITEIAIPLARRVIGAYAALGVVLAALTAATTPTASIVIQLACVALLGILFVPALSSRVRLPIGNVLAAAIAAGAAILSFVASLDADMTCSSMPVTWVGISLGLMVIAGLSMLARSVGWVVAAWLVIVVPAIAAWVINDGGSFATCGAAQIFDGRTQLVTFVLWLGLRILASRQLKAASEAQAEASRTTRTAAAHDARTSATVLRWTESLKPMRDFVRAIAVGDLNPAEPKVRQRAHELEKAARQLLLQSDLDDRLVSATAEMLEFAELRAVELDIYLPPEAMRDWPDEAIADHLSLVRSALQRCEAGCDAFVSLRDDTDGQTVVLVTNNRHHFGLQGSTHLRVVANRYSGQSVFEFSAKSASAGT